GASPATGGSMLEVLLPLRPTGSRPPLFCVHPAGGISWPYIGLARYLADHPLYGLQARGLAGPEELPATLEEMVADYLEQIRAAQPAGPYHLLGWSFGGVVAHALAAELQRAGEQVALLALLDAYPLGAESSQEAAPLSERDVLTLLLDAAGLSEEGPLDEELDRDRVMDLLRRKRTIPAELLEERALAAVIDVSNNNVRLLRGFTPGRFDGDLLLFTAAQPAPDSPPDDHPTPRAWQPYVDGMITIHAIASTHHHMMRPEALAQLGPILAAALEETGRRRPTQGS
ncbi:alpha/beta fold hydrolase, partial [Frankia sp. CiP1_Cm_nod2]|uniref:alpha/beta fold hydrolase n=1 Tax=Frankia sp. CiP1_Cm_nod2 TaxID=2897161 RepID=UPI00202417C4